LSIKFAAKVIVCLTLAGLFTSLEAQQTTTPSNQDSGASAQPQSTPKGQTGAAQPASSEPASPDKNASGQNPQQNPDKSDADKNDKDQQSESGQGKVAGTSNDRLFYALPNFLTLQKGKQLPPLSAKDKYKVVALGTFDYINYPWWGIISAISQADNSEPAYGQGWLAYVKRYGSTAGDSIIENFMVGAVYPAFLHQDPRFYYSPNGGFFRRTGYAISRIVVTRTDSGHSTFNFSEFFGSATAAAISTYTYHPGHAYVSTPSNPHLFITSEHTLGNAGTIWGTQMGLDTITLVIKEFWPDVHRKMRKARLQTTAAKVSNP
jgi:hypothetical protein